MKKALLLIGVAAMLVSCTKIISKEAYVDAMATLGCKMAHETSPEGIELLKEKGVTPEDIMNFRKKMKPEQIADIVKEISTKVAACHGVKLP